MIMGITMDTHSILIINMTDDALARLRLLQLVSPSLPVGGFSYSQGLEWAVESGWVSDRYSLTRWLDGLIDDGLARLDLPILVRLYDAVVHDDVLAIEKWSAELFAHRETQELRAEEQYRAKALTKLLIDLEVPRARRWQQSLCNCQAAPFALAAEYWRISVENTLLGYTWNWLENQVAAAIKLIPLGQTDGQRIQLSLAQRLPVTVQSALECSDDEIGSGAMALAVASSRHETQYTRLFRS